MEPQPSRYTYQQRNGNQREINMSTLALRPTPSMSREERQPRCQTEQIILPSIHQAVPEIQMRARQNVQEFRIETLYSPTAPISAGSAPEYIQSPSSSKRRRPSYEEDHTRVRTIPRRCLSPSRQIHPSENLALSPSSSAGHSQSFSSGDSYQSSSQSSPYMPYQGLPKMKTSSAIEHENLSRPEWRPTLPNIPNMNIERGATHHRGRSSVTEYSLGSSRTYPQMLAAPFNPPISYHHPTLSYGYVQPWGQSYSGPSGHPLTQDRTPFSNNHHNIYASSGFPYSITDFTDDNKQRKRRGNLPKETTDKLRDWFISHLTHPYPTEDEKQDLMRQTGLQINQISNWFINARRRQLPALIGHACSESDAKLARDVEGTRDVKSEHDNGNKPNIPPFEVSESEECTFDDEVDPRYLPIGHVVRPKQEI